MIRLVMGRIKTIFIQALLLCGFLVVATQASQELPVAVPATQARTPLVPERMSDKIRSMEKTAAEFSG